MIRANNAQKGVIMVWAMLSITILLGAITAGLIILQATNSALESSMEYYAQAPAMARAGLLDSLAWFRRQAGQPVTTFNPQLNLLADPPINDTDDAAIGIVRELEVSQSQNIWGRYEVDKTIVSDISAQRGLTGNGAIWKIQSKGLLYFRFDPTKSYNVWPNRVLTSVKLATEIRRVSIVSPAQAALCAGNPSQTVIGNNVKILGQTQIAIVYPPLTGTPNINGGAVVTGTLGATSTVTPYNDSTESVFGMTETELRSIADYYVTSVDQLPDPIPDYKIVFFEGNATFNSSHALMGTGIFYITGTLTMAANSGSSYNGVIYCKGHYHQLAPSIISGVVITKGQVNIESTGDISEIDYDAGILNQIQTYTGQYRLGKGIYEVQ
ncbi:MAG: hypothetical protein V1701_01235 [Planctomycetota bacterium]